MTIGRQANRVEVGVRTHWGDHGIDSELFLWGISPIARYVAQRTFARPFAIKVEDATSAYDDELAPRL